ncbi:MAG: tetratricopeptide repeat protein, partial [Deltaproteobacteria bacterium]|nr:tetratricopeptide repeat protein [Deltaproteobacteria bacterium]
MGNEAWVPLSPEAAGTVSFTRLARLAATRACRFLHACALLGLLGCASAAPPGTLSDAMLLEAHGDYTGAAMKYTKAIWENPKDASAYVRRARLYVRKGLYHKALVDFAQAVKYMPNGENYYNRGEIYHKMGMEEQAYTDFKKAVELGYKADMPARNIYFNSGMLLKDKGRAKEAAADFSIAIDADPSFAQAYLERAEIYLEQGLYKESLMDFNRALKYNRGDDIDLRDAVAGQGMAFYKAGMLDHALASALKLIAIVPSLTVHFNEKNALDIFDAGK